LFRSAGVKCFTKPVQLSTLLQAIRDACDGGKRQAPPAAAGPGKNRID
jgi:hypothetical protein